MALTVILGWVVDPACAFEGRINATLTRGGQVETFRYTIGPNDLCIERGETDRPHARNLLNRQTGDLTLLFPHNRSFVRLKAASPKAAPPMPGMPAPAPPMPPGIGPQAPGPAPPDVPARLAPPNLPALPPGIGPQAAGVVTGSPQPPAMPMMPAMPMPGMDPVELRATGEKMNLLGYACLRYELKQRGEVMEIWATDQLLSYQPWQANQPPRFGPQMLEEQWAELVKARKLFPLLARLTFENGPERLRFEVQTITPEKIEDRDGKLFQPPADYQELDPLPF